MSTKQNQLDQPKDSDVGIKDVVRRLWRDRTLENGGAYLAMVDSEGIATHHPVNDFETFRAWLRSPGHFVAGPKDRIKMFLDRIRWNCDYRVIVDGPAGVAVVGHSQSDPFEPDPYESV